MNGLLKYIIKNLIYIFMFIFLFLFLFTSTIMLAQSPTVKEISNFNKIRDQQKQICLKLKNNGFNDSSISVDNKILAKYYNAILDKILESNQDILSKYNKKASEFCILLVDETSEVRGFQSLGEGLIQVGIGPKFLLAQARLANTDADNATMISHEIIHNLLNHNDKNMTLIQNIKTEYQNIKEQKYTNFRTYLLSHPKYIEQSRSHEIEADNLGLKLYLRSGFKAKNFKELHLLDDDFRLPEDKPIHILQEKWDLFKKISKPRTCVLMGIDAMKLKMLNTFMEDIKYLSSLHIYPSGCFRFWNAHVQEQKLIKNKDIANRLKNIVNFLYLKLDLNSYTNLDNIKKINFNDIKNTSFDITNNNDPRFRIIMDLLLKTDTNISYTIVSDTNDKNDIGLIKEDNSITLKSSNLIKTILILKVKPSTPGFLDHLNKDATNPMKVLEALKAIFNDGLNKEIQNAFL